MTLAVALLSLALTTSRAERRHAKKLFEHASADYEAGHFEDALRDFEAAYELAPVPEILFNLAQCHYELHQPREAAIYYRRYLEARPKAPNAVQVRERLAELDRVEAAAAPKPKPQPRATPPPRKLPSAPVAAVNPPAVRRPARREPPGPTHALSLTLAGASAVCAVMGAYGIFRVADYLQLSAQVQSPSGVSLQDYNRAKATYANAQNWEWGAAGLLLLAAGGVVGAVYAW